LRGPAQFAPASPEAVIDDFEDGDVNGDMQLDMNLTRTVRPMAGSWVGFATPGYGTTDGAASAECVANGRHSGHVTGSQLMTYGGNWNAVLLGTFAQAIPFDASAYSGFSFWVAAGKNAVPPIELPIGVMTRDTSAGAGICMPCGDYYRVRTPIPLTRSWTRWVVKFSELKQSGQGLPQVVPLKKSELVSLMIWPENTYDIWIDDVRFEP
jgi:hypothetical protein